MVAATVTGRSVAAVHLTETTVWACHGDRTVDCPAGVLANGGSLVAGVTGPDVGEHDTYEPCPIRFVDDPVLLLGDTGFRVSEVLTAVLARALGPVGTSMPVDLLVLTCPTGWGSTRRRTLAAAGRALARDVRVLSVVEVVEAVVGTDGCGTVVEVGVLGSVATSTARAGTVTFDELGARDLAERGTAATELAAAVHGVRPDAPSWIAVTGDIPSGSGPLTTALQAAWDTPPRVLVVRGGALVQAAEQWGRSLLGESAPGEDESPRASGRRPRVLSVVGAVVAAAAVAGVTAWGFDRADTPVPPPAADVPVVPRPSTSAAPSAVVEARAGVGRASVTVPSGWHQRVPASRPDRVEMVRDDGHPARILLVRKELVEGTGLDAVAATLAAGIADRPDTFGSLSRVDVDARQALSYRETPDADSEVRWLVFVGADLQISIGCQGIRERIGDLEPDCERVVRSLDVTEK